MAPIPKINGLTDRPHPNINANFLGKGVAYL